ncbi:MAG: hypothetical protein K2P87_04360 [Lachnospiraceae bacterium]|nr:hypothetical protein [Lachnospiraceae bacterium]
MEEQEKLQRNKKIRNHIFNGFFNVLTIMCIPLIQTITQKNEHPFRTNLMFTLFIILLIFFAYREYHQYKEECENEQKLKNTERNARAKTILTQIVRLIDRKADNYRKNTYELKVVDKEWPYIYGVHNYLQETCENLKITIAKIIQEESSYVDVSLIYKYCSEREWKWLAGRSGISDMTDLNEFVRDSSTLYHYVMCHKEKAPVFCNDKSESNIYKPGRRDGLFNSRGSFYAMPITFCNNKEALVEAILLISTYGVNFIPLGSSKEQENEFRRILAYEVVPYYISIIQSELGALYMRHNLDKVQHYPAEGLGGRGCHGEGSSEKI